MWRNLDPSPIQNGKNSPQQKSLGGAPSEEGGGRRGRKGPGFWEECQPCGLAFCEENERWRDVFNGIDLWTIVVLCPTICAPATSPIQKWWQTVLETKVSCSQREDLTYTHEGSSFFLWGRRVSRIFFPPRSQYLPMEFSWTSSSSQVVPWYVPNSISLLSPYSLPKVQLSCL